MNLAAVGAPEFLGAHLGRGPSLFVDGFAGVGELGGGGTTHEQAFDLQTGLAFRPPRCLKEKSHRVKADKQYVLFRCRRATSRA